MNREKILQKLGIERLNAMQERALKAIGETQKDVIVLSPTGSGKTLAYLLPLVALVDANKEDAQALVLVPGRELALQSQTVLKDMGTGLRSMALYGGRPTMDEHREIRKVQPQIIFATPGRILDHLTKGNIARDGFRYLVIDEFDKCLQMGFHDEMSKVLGCLPNVKRRFLLSATDAEEIPDFVEMNRVERVDCIEGGGTLSERVKLFRVMSPEKDKLETLAQLLGELGEQSSIVFLNYRDSVERTAEFLSKRRFSVSLFHGGLDQRQREDALYRFSNGSALTLVCTDLASRGLDIPEVENIIHYHLPETQDNYIHRVGRTARWDKEGRAFFLLHESETLPEYVKEEVELFSLDASLPMHRAPAPRMNTLYIGKGKKDKISKGDIVGFLCKKGGLETTEIGRIDVKDRYAYVAVKREKVQQVLRQTKGEKIKGIKTLVELVK